MLLIRSSSLLSTIPVWGYTPFCLALHHQSNIGVSSSLQSLYKAITRFEYTFFKCRCVLIFLGQIPRCDIARSYGKTGI